MNKSTFYSLAIYLLTFLTLVPGYSATEKFCASRAELDPDGCIKALGYDLHALWVPLIQEKPAGFLGNDFVFEGDCGGVFTENDDGTATLIGTTNSESEPGKGFEVSIEFQDRSDDPSRDPNLECNEEPDISGWRYYPTYIGTLKGVGEYDGALVEITGVAHDFQIGDGANGKNFKFGGSGWFTWEVLNQPSNPEISLYPSSEAIPDDLWRSLRVGSLKRADFNVDLELLCKPFKEKVKDKFDTAAYNNNDGTKDWASDWIEKDPKGASQSPSEGQVRVKFNALCLDDYPNTGTEPSVSRKVDLSKAKFASLKFRFWTSSMVDPWDTIAVEASKDGGENFSVIQLIKGNYGPYWNYSELNISDFISEKTVIRFRVAKRYGAEWDLFCVDNVRILFGQDCDDECIPSSDHVNDKFNMVSFGNNDGSVNWITKWMENDPAWGGFGPSSGNVRVNGGTLELKDYPDTGGCPSAKRAVDLSCASVAKLSFDFWTPYVDYDDVVKVEISNDGGQTYSVLEKIVGRQAPDWRHRSYDITAFASSNTVVRFKIAHKYGGYDDFVCFDNVKISYICECKD